MGVGLDLIAHGGVVLPIAPVSVDPGVDMVHAVKAARKNGWPTRSADRVRAVAVWLRLSAELADRPLPSIAFNYLGNRAGFGSSDGNGDVPGFPAQGDAPSLPVTVSGCCPRRVLAVDATVVAGASQRRIAGRTAVPDGGSRFDRCRRDRSAVG